MVDESDHAEAAYRGHVIFHHFARNYMRSPASALIGTSKAFSQSFAAFFMLLGC